ncbi:MAG: hypothetical protein LBN71_10895 [Tannerella sp.]|jgi:hypothetical protein|nr:hypothetical protein [Tannerella sp.]
MKYRFVFILCLLSVSGSLSAQHVGEWQSYLASYNTTAVAETNELVFAVADGTLYSYGKEDNSIRIYSKQYGLSDSDIKLIGYNSTAKVLVIVYSNGNIDLLREEGLYNLPYLKNATNIRDKEVYTIYFQNERAYLATKFGVIVIQLNKNEIAETYMLNQATYAVCIQGESIYAATGNGLLKASVSDNLLDIHSWNMETLHSTEFKPQNIRQLCSFQDKLCFWADSSGVFYLNSGAEIKTLLKHDRLKGMKLQSDRLIPFSASTMYIYDSLSSYEPANVGVLNDVAALKNGGNYWIASGVNGLIGVKRTGANQYEPFVSGLTINGPKRNLAASLTFHGQKLYVLGGGMWTDRYFNPGTLMICENGTWTNIDENKVNTKNGYGCHDYTGIAIDPDDETHYFVSSYGEGVLEFKDNEFVQLYNHKNSALQTILPQFENNYNRVAGLCFDKNRNLWMTNSQVDNGIVVRKADGTWKSFHYPGVDNSTYLVDKIIVTSKGHKWVNVPRSGSRAGILVFDDKGTPDDTSDDIANFFSAFKSAANRTIEASEYYCVTEDLTGNIWIGTNKGPIICSSPARAIDNPDNLLCNNIIRSDEDVSYYFLNGEQVRAIAVDGGNRKWLGTSGSGAFLVSADGMETILHFDTDNSPLYSNNIQSIAINQQTGEVFFGTDKGLISYRGEAIEGSKSYSDVYAYPNPVRPDIDYQVTITGLMVDSNVKITDLNGNLIYQGKSAGGQMTWNCQNRSGNRVATGIYLVIAATPNAGESVVTKIAVVK